MRYRQQGVCFEFNWIAFRAILLYFLYILYFNHANKLCYLKNMLHIYVYKYVT